MTTTAHQTTASAVVPGDVLHRVKQMPRSRVFENAIDAVVLAVTPFTDDWGRECVRIDLVPEAPAISSCVNLDPERVVWVAA